MGQSHIGGGPGAPRTGMRNYGNGHGFLPVRGAPGPPWLPTRDYSITNSIKEIT